MKHFNERKTICAKELIEGDRVKTHHLDEDFEVARDVKMRGRFVYFKTGLISRRYAVDQLIEVDPEHRLKYGPP